VLGVLWSIGNWKGQGLCELFMHVRLERVRLEQVGLSS
jgi:hypothetical protein